MLLKDRLAARIRDNLAWEALRSRDRCLADPAEPPPSPWPLLRRLWPAPNDEFVRGVYRMILGRDPDPKGFAERLLALRTGTPRATVVREIAVSEEAAARKVDTSWLDQLVRYTPSGIWSGLLDLLHRPAVEFVRGTYELLLQRPADPDGLVTYLAELADGRPRVAIIQTLASSIEFCTAGTDPSWLPRLRLLTLEGLRDRLVVLLGAGDEDFIRGLYDAVLHREPSSADLGYYLDAIGRGDQRPAIVREFLTSEEARGRYAGPAWDAALAALFTSPPEPTPPAMPAITPAVPHSAPTEDFGWVSATDPVEFVRAAYRSVLGREPTPAEVVARVRRLRYVPFYTRNKLLNSLARSWEAQAAARRETAGHFQACERDRARWAADAARAATSVDHVTSLADRLARLDRRVAELISAADTSRASGFMEELHRELQSSRQQLATLLQVTGRVPEGLAEHLRRIELSAANPGTITRLAEAVTGMRAVVDRIAYRHERLRKAVPRLLGPGRELLTGQRALLAGQRALLAGQQEVLTGQQTALEGQRTILNGQQTVIEGQQEIRATQREATARGAAFAERHRELLAQQQHLARDQERLAGGLDQVITEQVRQTAVYHAIRSEIADDRFVTGVWFDQLRRVGATVAESVGARVPAATSPAADRHDRCRVCGGELMFKWAGRVLHDRYEAEYHECRACQALQIPNPVWLPEAYRCEADPLLWNPDTGRFRRNYTAYRLIRALAAGGLPADRVLDYGGGYGLLVQMLTDAGVDAWLHDPYVAQPYFAGTRSIPDLKDAPAGAFDLVTAFEVAEHLTDPVRVGADLRRVLRPGGAFVLSTGLYEPGLHGPDWPYLTPLTGQHILFWSRAAFRAFAARQGLRSVAFVTGEAIDLTVLADRPADDLDRAVRAAADRLKAHPDPATQDWLLARDTRVSVESVPTEGGNPCAS